MTCLLALALTLLNATAADRAAGWSESPSSSPTAHPASAVLGDGGASAAPGPVESALREGDYPWYDPDTDRVKPIWAAKRPWLKWIRQRFESIGEAIGKFLDRFKFDGWSGGRLSGESIVTVVLMVGLIAFLIVLFALWSRRGLSAVDRSAAGSSIGRSARMAALPEGVRPGSADPWSEAVRRRAAGDLGGAIVCLFAYQLLTLDHLGLIRLVPGRTGRQYVQTIHDPYFVGALEATLGLFEDVYYGRRLPTPEAFEAVWHSARVFRERRDVAEALR